MLTAGGGFSDTVSLADLSGPDINDGVYSDISADGGPPETVTVTNGYSLQRLFAKVFAAPRTAPEFGAVEVPVPGGRSVIINASQADSLGAYADGPPVVWQDASGTHFLLPSSAGYPGELVTGANVTIELYSGAALAVGIYAPSKVIVGRPVHFQSDVGGAPGPFDYSWQFGDGSGSSLASPTHTFTATGVYTAYLEVTAGGNSLGQSTPMTITVGAVPAAPATQSGVIGGQGSGGSGSGTGQGSGVTPGGAGAATGTQPTATSASSTAVKHRHHRAPRPTRPAGPVVSGIAISYVGQPLTASAAAAAGAAAARAAHLRASTNALDVGMWIWFGVLSLLFGGALLEWVGPRRARLAISEVS